ncbi:VanZ family protein [Mycetocola miduiensis]|nr:VanZ family protein [Mycetocola miduiensis]
MLHRHPVLGLFTLAYLAFVGWVTLGPQPFDDDPNGMVFRLLAFFDRHAATSWITYNGLEFTANIGMFLPIGLFLVLLFGRRLWWFAMLLGFGITVAIETAQLFLPTRVSDPRDIVANTCGAVIGVLVGLILTARKARALRLAQARRPVAATR